MRHLGSFITLLCPVYTRQSLHFAFDSVRAGSFSCFDETKKKICFDFLADLFSLDESTNV